jgi:bacteriorhodopsin
MLGSGYLGELGYMDRNKSNMIGFAFFIALYGFIYQSFLKNKPNKDNSILFWSFVILWSFYGIFYQTEPIMKNIGYNILDLSSKCFVGIFFWAYYTGVFKLN